jgi:hypothetical protein
VESRQEESAAAAALQLAAGGRPPKELDADEAKRQARFARVKQEVEGEEDVADDRTRLKGESDEFPEDMRVT